MDTQRQKFQVEHFSNVMWNSWPIIFDYLINLKKAVDADFKSKQVEHLVTRMLANKLEIGDSFVIKTPSFIISHHKVNAYGLKPRISIQSGSSFKLPSFCNLTNDCSDKVVLIKVFNNFQSK